MVPNNSLTKIELLIKKGEGVLATHTPNPPNVLGFPTLDGNAYAEWNGQALNFLINLLGREHIYVKNFQDKGRAEYTSTVESGLGILRAVQDDLAQGDLEQPKSIDVSLIIEQLCTRFHLVARQLRLRHDSRETLSVTDEYDVQDLLHSLLWLYFEDVRAEEYTPSYAGKSSRMDFLLKRESTVIELKKTSPKLGIREISTQLIEDIERYKSHPDCKALYCFVYDPEGFIPNPRGLEADLRRDTGAFPVHVYIRPL